VTTTLTSAIVPLVFVLLGGGLTYWLNVRTRRRSRVEDLFDEAIAAVAVADASKNYLRRVAKPAELSESDYRSLLSNIARTAVEVHIQRAAEARETIAKVVQYEQGPTLLHRRRSSHKPCRRHHEDTYTGTRAALVT
jgi:hypothetical protein